MTNAPELHVLCLIDRLGWGGAEMLLAELAAAAPAAGLRVSVGYLQDTDGSPAAARLRAVGVVPELIGIERLLSLRSLRRVRRYVAAVQPDVVHAHLGYSDFLGGIAARSLHVPAVSTIHLAHWKTSDVRGEALKLWLFAQARRRCMSRVLAVSDAARRAYLKLGWDLPDRVTTVHNGVRDSRSVVDRTAVRAEFGIDAGHVVITMVSVLRQDKGHRAAFEAIAGLSRDPQTAHARLLVLGDGPARAEIQSLARPFGDRIIFCGHRDDVPAILGASDILVHPSVHDAFPTALLEAMAASLPVVATNVGGIPEITLAGVTGELVEAPATGTSLAEALRPLVRDSARRAELGRRGRARYEDVFTVEAWVNRLRLVYDDVVTARTR